MVALTLKGNQGGRESGRAMERLSVGGAGFWFLPSSPYGQRTQIKEMKHMEQKSKHQLSYQLHLFIWNYFIFSSFIEVYIIHKTIYLLYIT